MSRPQKCSDICHNSPERRTNFALPSPAKSVSLLFPLFRCYGPSCFGGSRTMYIRKMPIKTSGESQFVSAVPWSLPGVPWSWVLSMKEDQGAPVCTGLPSVGKTGHVCTGHPFRPHRWSFIPRIPGKAPWPWLPGSLTPGPFRLLTWFLILLQQVDHDSQVGNKLSQSFETNGSSGKAKNHSKKAPPNAGPSPFNRLL